MFCTPLKLLHWFMNWDIYLHKFYPRDRFSLPFLPTPLSAILQIISPVQFIRIHRIMILVDYDIRHGGRASGEAGSAKVLS